MVLSAAKIHKFLCLLKLKIKNIYNSQLGLEILSMMNETFIIDGVFCSFLTNNDIKYRYVKAMGEITSDNLMKL